jgi:serine/threonine protein kinase
MHADASKPNQLSEPTAKRLFRQVGSGLKHMHTFGCFHRDLKLENLVVDRRFDVKIIDFGAMKFLDQMATHVA